MLHNRQQFHMREVHAPHIFSQFGGYLPVTERAIVILRDPHPRSQVDFVNRNRSLERIFPGALLHPRLVVPFVVQVPNHGSSPWRGLMQQPYGVSFITSIVILVGNNMEFINGSFANSRDEAFPNTGTLPCLHGMGARVPAIEISNDGNMFCIRRPHTETDARRAVGSDHMRPHLFVKAVMAALVEKMKIVRCEQAYVSPGRSHSLCHAAASISVPDEMVFAGFAAAPKFRVNESEGPEGFGSCATTLNALETILRRFRHILSVLSPQRCLRRNG